MSSVFLILFPCFALTIYLPFAKKVAFIHAPLEILALVMLITGVGLGASLAKEFNVPSVYHPVVGYIVTATLFLFQPALGLLQHLHFRRTGQRGLFGHAHQWLGRTMMTLGIINGGLGLRLSGPIGTENEPRYGVIVYSIVAAAVFLMHVAAVVFLALSRRGANADRGRSGFGREKGDANRSIRDE